MLPYYPVLPTMLAWFKARYRAFQNSYDPNEAMVGSSPAAIGISAATLSITIACLGYVPTLAEASGLQRPWIALLLTAVAAAISLTAYTHRCRGGIGTWATLLDSAFWSGTLMYLAVSTNGNYAIGLALANALATLMVPARIYSLTLFLGVLAVLPAAAMVVLFRPSGAVTVLLWVTVVLALLIHQMTGHRREMARRQQALERALGAADHVADESMQAALGTMLLSLGHFVHELRNYQTSVATNLSFIESVIELDEEARDALADIKQALAAEQKLVTDTLEDLRLRSAAEVSTFRLVDALSRATQDSCGGLEFVVNVDEPKFTLRGNAEHLRVIITNLVRNAAQAGATKVHIDCKTETTLASVLLVVHDDGPGIPLSRRDSLFEPFGSSSKSEGTGLGLYLCRRYVGLFGGTVAVQDGPLGGAAFVIRLPGVVECKPSLSVAPRSQSRLAAS